MSLRTSKVEQTGGDKPHNLTKKVFGRREQLLSKDLEASKQSMNSTARETGALVNRDSTELTKGPKVPGGTDKKGSSSRVTGLRRLTSSKNVKLQSNMGDHKGKSYSQVMLEKEDQIL